MKVALNLAEKGRGTTAPNPMVGCVLLRDGAIVGSGWHERAGGPHAEVVALREAGEQARGATAYVTLEPCSHHGRTPPCAEALIAAGVSEVHVAMVDPNPRVAGRGVDRLRAAGIAVTVGEQEAAARELNEQFIHYVTTGRPYVIAKWAMTLDGKIATGSGHSRWVTGPEARQQVHRTRNEVTAILVGRGTVLADDPQLTTRLPGASPEAVRHPLRVVLDSRGTLPPDLRLFDPAMPGKTLVATTEAAAAAWQQTLEARGVEVLRLPADDRKRVRLSALLEQLGARELSSLLVEGGATVHASFLEQQLVNRVHAYVAPKLAGGHAAPGPIGGTGVSRMDQAVQLKWRAIEPLGEDLLLEADLRHREEGQPE